MKDPRALDLPFDAWRPGQRLAIRTALHSKTAHTVIQSPTGSGKSIIAAAIMKHDDRRTTILTATRGLEDQYARVFPFLVDVRGMGNYECLAAKDEFRKLYRLRRGPVMCDEGACRSGRQCGLKSDGCLYFDQRRAYLAAETGLTNYSYMLAMRRYGGGLGPFHRLILDEAHALPEELMSTARIEVPTWVLETQGERPPTTWQGWTQWAAKTLADMKTAPADDSREDQRQRKTRLQEALEHLAQIDETWAWDFLDTKIIFEPTIPRLLMPMLADVKSGSQQLVYLSATITRATLRLLGIADRDVTFQVMASRFDPRRRPIYVVHCIRNDHKATDVMREWQLHQIDKYIGERVDRKGILHAVSYDRARWFQDRSAHRGIMVAPPSASKLAAAVDRFRRMQPPALLISPSVMTGWDFPYTDCEYQILPKMPFPDTRSAIARARIAATDGYRDHLTAQAVEQAIGRGMRATDDQCETVIFDSHAEWFLPMAVQKELLSMSFVDAVHYVRKAPPPLPALS